MKRRPCHRTAQLEPSSGLAGVLGSIILLAVLAAGALPHIWQAPISDLYHAGLGVVGVAAASVALVEVSIVAGLGVFTLIVFHLVLGWRTYRISHLP